MELLEQLEEFGLISVCIRLSLATVLGGLIGIERGAHGQPAGVRTFALVCLGSCLAMITDEYLVENYALGDPARLAAQVISGIGFLGVGTIIITGKNYVRGLTTAAGLWVTACLGIAIGSGYIAGSLAAFVLICFVMTVLTYISHQIDNNARGMVLYVETDKTNGIPSIYKFSQENHLRIKSIEKQKKQSLQEKDSVYMIKYDLLKRRNHEQVIQKMYEEEMIHYIEEIR